MAVDTSEEAAPQTIVSTSEPVRMSPLEVNKFSTVFPKPAMPEDAMPKGVITSDADMGSSSQGGAEDSGEGKSWQST